MSRHKFTAWITTAALAVTSIGCRSNEKEYYFDDPSDALAYRAVATEISYPDVEEEILSDVQHAKPPLTIREPHEGDLWDLTLQEAIEIALTNSKVIRNLGGRVIGSPQAVSTVYEPAITESNPGFGVEGALSQFDAQLTSSILWERNETPTNQVLPGFILPVRERDQSQFDLEISKTTATGGNFALRNNTSYLWTNSPANRFPSAWTTNIELEARHPLLQGAGVTFNRIAGPNATSAASNFNGVTLARINTDVALADFEISTRNLVSDVENAYWDLYFAYRDFDAKVKGRDSAVQTWRKIYALYINGARGGEAEKEAQAREQYFLFRSLVENSLSGTPGGSTISGAGGGAGQFRGAGGIYSRESNLRFLLGIAATDGRLIRPTDEPLPSQVSFDWDEITQEAIYRRAELRRQRWVVKRDELELIASRNFLMPRLDGVATYRWLGFGDDFWNSSQGSQFSQAVGELTNGDFQEWQLGATFSMPIGFRQAHAGVRNSQLKLARDRAVLQDQELEVSHGLSDAIRELDRSYQLAGTNFNRRLAAKKQVEAVDAAYQVDKVTLDVLLLAQRRLADAEVEYYRSLVEYNMAIKSVHFEKGSLLEYNGVRLAEGLWPGKAYCDAERRGNRRQVSKRNMNYVMTLPQVVSQGRYLLNPGADIGAMEATGVIETGEPTIVEPAILPEPTEVDDAPELELKGQARRTPVNQETAKKTGIKSRTISLQTNEETKETFDWSIHLGDNQVDVKAPKEKVIANSSEPISIVSYKNINSEQEINRERSEDKQVTTTSRSTSVWTTSKRNNVR